MTPIDMRATARKAGKSYDRFGKTWKSMVRHEGFPAPASGGRDQILRGNYVWDGEAVDAWAARRAGERADQLRTPAAANDATPRLPAPPRNLARQHAEISLLMAKGA